MSNLTYEVPGSVKKNSLHNSPSVKLINYYHHCMFHGMIHMYTYSDLQKSNQVSVLYSPAVESHADGKVDHNEADKGDGQALASDAGGDTHMSFVSHLDVVIQGLSGDHLVFLVPAGSQVPVSNKVHPS